MPSLAWNIKVPTWCCGGDSDWHAQGGGHKDECNKIQKGPWKKSAATRDWATVHLSAPQLPEANSQDNAHVALRQSWPFLSGSAKGQTPRSMWRDLKMAAHICFPSSVSKLQRKGKRTPQVSSDKVFKGYFTDITLILIIRLKLMSLNSSSQFHVFSFKSSICKIKSFKFVYMSIMFPKCSSTDSAGRVIEARGRRWSKKFKILFGLV